MVQLSFETKTLLGLLTAQLGPFTAQLGPLITIFHCLDKSSPHCNTVTLVSLSSQKDKDLFTSPQCTTGLQLSREFLNIFTSSRMAVAFTLNTVSLRPLQLGKEIPLGSLLHSPALSSFTRSVQFSLLCEKSCFY